MLDLFATRFPQEFAFEAILARSIEVQSVSLLTWAHAGLVKQGRPFLPLLPSKPPAASTGDFYSVLFTLWAKSDSTHITWLHALGEFKRLSMYPSLLASLVRSGVLTARDHFSELLVVADLRSLNRLLREGFTPAQVKAALPAYGLLLARVGVSPKRKVAGCRWLITECGLSLDEVRHAALSISSETTSRPSRTSSHPFRVLPLQSTHPSPCLLTERT